MSKDLPAIRTINLSLIIQFFRDITQTCQIDHGVVAHVSPNRMQHDHTQSQAGSGCPLRDAPPKELSQKEHNALRFIKPLLTG